MVTSSATILAVPGDRCQRRRVPPLGRSRAEQECLVSGGQEEVLQWLPHPRGALAGSERLGQIGLRVVPPDGENDDRPEVVAELEGLGRGGGVEPTHLVDGEALGL